MLKRPRGQPHRNRLEGSKVSAVEMWKREPRDTRSYAIRPPAKRERGCETHDDAHKGCRCNVIIEGNGFDLKFRL